jgi:hypothetical protein
MKIIRRPNANGTNLVDKTQPVIVVYLQSGPPILMSRGTTLCLEEGAIYALDATDEQIRRAIEGDESVFIPTRFSSAELGQAR